MQRMSFIKKEVDGREIICEVIATYHCEQNNKDYIVYTDRTFDENKKLRVYYSLYKMNGNHIHLINTTSNEDKKIGLKLIEEIIKNLR